MNPSSLVHSQQEQLSRSQDPNNMTTQNQDQLSRSQDLNKMIDLIDLKKSATASVVEMDSLGLAKEREADLTHHASPASSHSLSLSLNSNHGLKCSCDNKKNGLMIFKVYTFLTNTLKMKKKRKKSIYT